MTLEQCAAAVRRGHAVWSQYIDDGDWINWVLYQMKTTAPRDTWESS